MHIKLKDLLLEGMKEDLVIEFIKESIKGTEWENFVFITGGAIRDELMGLPIKDIDLMINKPNGGILFAEWMTKKYGLHSPITFPTFGTAKFDLNGITYKGMDLSGIDIECVMARGEKYTTGSRKPEVHFGGLKADIERRDATINSLIKNISTGEILDLTGRGVSDLKAGIMRTPLNPDVTFSDDPLRMLRFCRQSTKYGFDIPLEILRSMKRNAHKLDTISKERIQDELNKMLININPEKALKLLKITGLLNYIIPEFKAAYKMTQNIHHSRDVFGHTLDVVKNTQPVLYQRLLALFHDIGKTTTRSVTPTGVHFYGHEYEGAKIVEDVMRRLKYPVEMIDAVKKGVAAHMRLKHGGDDAVKLTDKTLRKFKIEMGEHLEDILNVIHADNVAHAEASSMPNQINNIKKRLDDLNVTVSKPTLPINGNDLIQMGIKPGPVFSKILEKVTEKWYENPDITKEAALKLAKSIANNPPPKKK